jgi:hypothetical protein
MTEPIPFRMCLIGLPATGKTTFIAALWAFLRSGQPPDRYRVTKVPENPAYLNAIAKAWTERAEMPRSSPGMASQIEFTIEVPSGDPVTVVLPDLPGEVFLNAIRRPSIDEEPADAVTSSDLLIVFVNGQTARTVANLGDQETPAETSPEAPSPPDGADGPNPTGTEFVIGDLDSDTLNTELLQRLVCLMRDQPTPPIVVVVSAWDVLVGLGQTPEQWLKHEQPMTWQYIEELRRTTIIGVVGISAQGADYSDDPNIVRKSSKERAWGCDGDSNRTDIAGPLLWYHRSSRAAHDG